MTPANDVAGPYDGRGNDDEWGARHADILTRIMSADLAVIPRDYDRAAILEYPGAVTGLGWSDADRFWMGLRAAFPDAELHHPPRHRPRRSPDAAPLRPALVAPRQAFRLGRLRHAHRRRGLRHGHVPRRIRPLRRGRPPCLRREWTLIDETAIWKQILLKTGAHE